MSDRSEADYASNDLVERVVRAMWEAAGADPHDFWADDFRAYECQARAAIAVCMEEAARVADRNAAEAWNDPNAHDTRGLMRLQADDLAAAIRSLIPKENK